MWNTSEGQTKLANLLTLEGQGGWARHDSPLRWLGQATGDHGCSAAGRQR